MCKITIHTYGYLALNLAFISPFIYCWFPIWHSGLLGKQHSPGRGALQDGDHQSCHMLSTCPTLPPSCRVRPPTSRTRLPSKRGGHGVPWAIAGPSDSAAHSGWVSSETMSTCFQISFFLLSFPKYELCHQVHTIFKCYFYIMMKMRDVCSVYKL